MTEKKKDAYFLYLDWYGAIASGELSRGRVPKTMDEGDGAHAIAFALAAHHALDRSEPMSKEEFEAIKSTKLADKHG